MIPLKFTNRTYDTLKWIVRLFIPAAATFYVAIAHIWHISGSDIVVYVSTAVVTFFSLVLTVSKRSYTPEQPEVPVTPIKTLLLLSDKTYDRLVSYVTVIIPGFIVLYLSIAKVLPLAYSFEVAATATATCAFLGVLLGISNALHTEAQKTQL